MGSELLGELSQRKPLCSTCDHPMKTHYEGGCIQCDECLLDFPDVLDAHLAARVASAAADREAVERVRLLAYTHWLFDKQNITGGHFDHHVDDFLRAARSEVPPEADGADRG